MSWRFELSYIHQKIEHTHRHTHLFIHISPTYIILYYTLFSCALVIFLPDLNSYRVWMIFYLFLISTVFQTLYNVWALLFLLLEVFMEIFFLSKVRVFLVEMSSCPPKVTFHDKLAGRCSARDWIFPFFLSPYMGVWQCGKLLLKEW